MKKTVYMFFAVMYLIFGASFVMAASAKEKQIDNNDKVVRFLQDSKVFYIATIDGDKPRVRPFGAVLNIDGKVSICTGAFKNVYKQIEQNPNVEISAMSADGKWIRVSGSLTNITNEANQKKFFEAMPNLEKIYSGDKKKDFTVLSFKSGTATIEDMTGNKEVIELK